MEKTSRTLRDRWTDFWDWNYWIPLWAVMFAAVSVWAVWAERGGSC